MELEKSFTRSVESCDAAASKKLGDAFSEHFISGGPPALVLNTTWAERGYRVAFAPFVLEGDGTVYSFLADMLGADGKKMSVMRAAAASARFPGILPPYSIMRQWTDNRGQQQTKRWNFVDGGYSDPSGAATALEIYQALEKLNQSKSMESSPTQDIDLKLILLTGVQSDATFADADGTPFRDVMAPIDAILSVRGLLAGQSVTRVIKLFGKDSEQLKVVELQDELFALPLGWTISRATFGVVSMLMGRSDLCPDKKLSIVRDDGPRTEQENEQEILRRNSCKVRDIKEVLNRKR